MKKLIAILLCMCVCLSSFLGCAGDTNVYDADGNVITDQSKILDINVWNSGYGINWINALANQFKKDNPGTGITIQADDKSGNFQRTAQLDSASANSIDLYFNYAPDYQKPEYIKNLEPLNDIINAPAATGETMTIGEKFGDATMSALGGTKNAQGKYEGVAAYNGNLYVLNYGSGSNGIVYNARLFDACDIEVPKTTNEFKSLVAVIKDNISYNDIDGVNLTGKYPLYNYPGYWTNVIVAWWLQYEGAENYSKFFSFDGISNPLTEDMNRFNQDGMKYALQALKEIITPAGISSPKSTETENYMANLRDFIDLETAFMYPCGSFFETEYTKNPQANISRLNNFKIMRYPVISNLAEKLSKADARDSDLSALVDYVDKIADGQSATKPAWATDADVELVYNARFASTGAPTKSTVCIPNYSPSKELAKKFLQYMYSDAGMKVFAEAQHSFLSVEFDNDTLKNSINTSSWTAFAKSALELSKVRVSVPQDMSHPVYALEKFNDMNVFRPNSVPETLLLGGTSVETILAGEWSNFKSEWETNLYSQYFN